MTEDRHACLAGPKCRASVVEDGRKLPAKTEAPDTLCRACVKALERALEELPQLWVRLQLALGDKHTGQGQKVSGTRTLPIPLSTAAEELQAGIVEWLCAAAARVAEQLNADDPQPTSRITAEHARIVQACIRLITPHIDKLLASETDAVTVWGREGDATTLTDMSGVDIALELKRLHKRAKLLLEGPGGQRDLPCPLCESLTVHRHVYKNIAGKVHDIVVCDSCGKDWDYERYGQICEVAERHINEEDAEDEVDEQQVAELEALRGKVDRLHKLVGMPDAEVEQFSPQTLIAYLKEVLAA